MDWNLYFITPLGGAVIGYFTNWLAIKMLFRPHEQKKLLGFKLPFTPGLIPKGRYQLSEKIGNTLGQHILTKDVILETVLENEGAIEKILDGYIEKLTSNPLTVQDIIEMLSGDGLDKEADAFAKHIRDMLVGTIKSPDSLNKISELVFGVVVSLLKSENAADLALSLMDKLKPQLLEGIKGYLQSGALSDFVENSAGSLFTKLQADERELGELIPERAVEIIKNTINEKLPSLAVYIKNLPFVNPTIDNTLRELTNKLVDENIGSIAALFVSKDKIYSNIRFGLFEYLSNQENIKTITDKAGEVVDNFLSKSAAYYISKLPPDADEQLREGLYKIISENISYEFVEKIIINIYDSAVSFLEKNDSAADRTIYGVIDKYMPEFEESLKRYIKQRVYSYIEDNIRSIVDLAWAAVSAYVMKFRVDTFVAGVKPETMGRFKDRVIRLIKNLLDKAADTLLEGIDIARITEEQINKFDMQTAEDITISVVNRELKAITYLGGVLGLVIGLLPAFMSLF